MDYITAPYVSKMRIYRDRPDVLVLGEWRWCPPGAKPIPYAHIFGSSSLDPESYDTEPVLGEIQGRQGRSRGITNPRLDGQHYCGPRRSWESGALFSTAGQSAVDAEGVPICCQAAPLRPGGAVIMGIGNGYDGPFPSLQMVFRQGGNPPVALEYIVRDGLRRVFDRLRMTTLFSTMQVGLYVSNTFPTATTTMGDIVEGSWMGYARVLGAAYGSATNPTDETVRTIGQLRLFRNSSPVTPTPTIFGWFIVDPSDNTLIFVTRFVTPFILNPLQVWGSRANFFGASNGITP